MSKSATILEKIRPGVLIPVFVGLALLYLGQSLLYMPRQSTLEKYQITAEQATLLTLTIAIPFLLIWLVALLGYKSLWSYTRKIADDKDGRGFTYITLGILLLVIWLPATNIIGNFTTHYHQLHPESVAAMVRIKTYVNLLVILPGFYLIYKGAGVLTGILKNPIRLLPPSLFGGYLLFCALYIYLTFQNPARNTATPQVEVGTYYLPDWLILTTVVIPRIVMWFLGLLAVYKIYQYKKNVKGTLYKEALTKLALGIGWVVLATISLRVFQTLSVQVSGLNLGSILLIIYLLLIVISVGYILIHQGSKRLQRLEEL